MTTLTQDTINGLICIARREMWTDGIDSDDFMPDDFAGGNMDDSYYAGCRDGETQLARDILDELEIEWEIIA